MQEAAVVNNVYFIDASQQQRDERAPTKIWGEEGGPQRRARVLLDTDINLYLQKGQHKDGQETDLCQGVSAALVMGT